MWRRRHRCKSRIKKITTIVLIVIVVFTVYLFHVWTSNSALINSIEINSVSLVTRAINSAITEVLTNRVVYDELITISRDDNMNIVMVQANSYQINTLSRSFAQATEAKIKEVGIDGVPIPLGTFSGINLLVGRGPKINVMVSPVGAVSCIFLTQFNSAGINQTNHRILLQINVEVGVVLPVTTHYFTTQQDILLSESVLIGKVPQVYLNYTRPSPLFDLIP